MDRRRFLKCSAASLMGLSALPGLAKAQLHGGGWLTGFGGADGAFGAARIDADLSVTPVVSSQMRLHDVLLSPNGRDIVAPARRPGDVLSVARGDGETLVIEAPADRHYFGHGAYSRDGAHLFVTENDFDNERGVVGVYDVTADYKRIDEFPGHGIGPHELRLSPDGRHLVVANGGILTHPGTGRAKLNLDTMKPNLTLLEIETQRPVDSVELPEKWHQLSIRHTALTPHGDVVFGMQDQQKPYGNRPVAGIWRMGRAPTMFEAPQGGWAVLKGYVGSVAIDNSGQIAVAVSPRGGVAVFWDIASARIVGALRAADVCGVAPTPQAKAFVMTTGMGAILMVDVTSSGVEIRRTASSSVWFDNHCHMA